jgi:ferredoxin-thioredoxin reductase catalytic subunit
MIKTNLLQVSAESPEHNNKYCHPPCHIQQKRGLESQMVCPCELRESLYENESTCHDSRDYICQVFHLGCALDQTQIR